jgi:hypothetical protein
MTGANTPYLCFEDSVKRFFIYLPFQEDRQDLLQCRQSLLPFTLPISPFGTISRLSIRQGAVIE